MLNPLYIPYVILMLLAGIVSLLVAAYAWPRRAAPGGFYFVLMALAAAIWALTAAGELAAMTIPVKIFWGKLSYLGITSVSLLWFLFALSYSQRAHWLTHFRLALLGVIPVVSLLLALTNEWHQLIWPRITPISETPGAVLVYEHGLIVWVLIAYSYGLMLVGTVWLVQTAIRSPHLYRNQVIVLLMGALIPWVGHILYTLRLSPLPGGFDLAPVSFALSGVAMTWGIFRLQMLDIVPIALDTLIEEMPDGFLALDTYHRIVDVNPAVCRLTGCNTTSLIGQPITSFLATWSDLVARYPDDQEMQTEVMFDGPNGRQWLELRRFPLREGRKPLTGQLVLLHDITARKQAEESLQQYARELEARNAELDAFAHTVAHDLKTPLANVAGFGNLVEKRLQQMSSADLAESIYYIVHSSHRMVNIIDELLLLASVRQHTEVPLSPLDMAAIVAEVQDRMRGVINERQGRIVLPAAWPVAVGYAAWVEEVWVNYISNALKYGGDPPVVELGFDEPAQPVVNQSSSDRTGEAALPGAQIRFWVKDNGPGLTPEEQRELFIPFTRLTQVRAKGHGLGLSIVRRIVEKLGGQVGVDSQVGQGSTFWFTLPQDERIA